jgi:spore maturation protein CgeB
MSRILFIGDLNTYGRGYQRCRTLMEMGHDVVAYSHTFVSSPETIQSPTLLYRILWKLRLPLDDMGINSLLKSEAKKSNFDVIWIEKGNMIWPSTLASIKKMSPDSALISCSEDDMYARHGHSLWYKWGLNQYDCVFTTKTYNLQELKHLGAKKTKLFLDSYDEKIHRPVKLTAADLKRFGCDVGAIGAFEPERAALLEYLAENGVKVSIWGNGWGSWVGRNANLDVRNKFLFGEDYSKAICATKINLNFLRKINRDEVTSRSIEIPACGGFMLAERTERHKDFFEEGKEAEFFESKEELLAKVIKYLSNNMAREMIARAGREKCLICGYSMSTQISKILDEVTTFKNSAKHNKSL